jgi:hypothetical protein
VFFCQGPAITDQLNDTSSLSVAGVLFLFYLPRPSHNSVVSTDTSSLSVLFSSPCLDPAIILSVAGVLTMFFLPRSPAIILLFLLILVLAVLSVAGVLTMFFLPRSPAIILLFLLILVFAGLSVAWAFFLFFLPKPQP